MAEAFKEINMSDGSESVQAIFQDAQLALRFGDVPWLLRVLADHENFIEAAWLSIKPLLTHGFDDSADGIRAEVVSLVSESFPGNDLRESLSGSGLNSVELEDFIDTILAYHFVDTKMLLISASLIDALHDKRVGVESIVVMPTGRGVPLGMPRIERSESASGVAVSESANISSIATTPDYLQALSKWPGSVELLWKEIKAGIESPAHDGATEKAAVLTAEAVGHLRRRMDLGKRELALLGIDDSEKALIVEKVEAAYKIYLNSVVDVAYAALLAAGPEAAAMSGEEMLLKWKLPR